MPLDKKFEEDEEENIFDLEPEDFIPLYGLAKHAFKDGQEFIISYKSLILCGYNIFTLSLAYGLINHLTKP